MAPDPKSAQTGKTDVLALWIALSAVLSRWGGLDRLLGALALFAGCGLILIENLVHAARQQR